MATYGLGTYSPFEPLSEEALLSLGSMEGLDHASPRKQPFWKVHGAGYLTAALVGGAAYAIHYLPFPPLLMGSRRPVSASIIAILVAVLVRAVLTVPRPVMAGCKHIVRNMVPLAIVCTGAGLSLSQAASIGWRSIVITMVCVGVAVGTAVAMGRLLGLMKKTSLLIGAGTAICGTSAILAVAPLIEAEDEDVTLSVGTVSLLGLILMFTLPVAGALLALDQNAFGVWAGTSIHAVPQVVAAGFTYGAEAGTLATLVKLARVTLLAPFILLLTLAYRAEAKRPGVSYGRLIPAFVWGFLILAALNTAGLLPALEFPASSLLGSVSLALGPWLVAAGNGMLTLAMAAIGLEVNLRLLVRVGGRALLAGAAAMVVLCAASLALIRTLF